MINKVISPMVIVVTASFSITAAQDRFVFERADTLPEIVIDGEKVKIHTQGLYVTDTTYWVTGRLEKKPKRALLMRFMRDDLGKYETIDITPQEIDGETLDHPGGFDVDSAGQLWIPLSTSHPAGPSLIYRLAIKAGKDLSSAEWEVAFRVNDHIGAICLAEDGSVIGANWDTKHVYVWLPNGKLLRRIDRNQLFSSAPDWQLAVQDWKAVEMNDRVVIIAGGLDRSRDTDRATIQLMDILRGKIHQTYRFPLQTNVSRPITNEGLDVHGRELFLLPEDLGRGAKVLRYRINAPQSSRQVPPDGQ